MRRAVGLLAVAAVVALAGCGGLAGDAAPEPTPTDPGVTPAPVPEATTTPGPDDGPRASEENALEPAELEALEPGDVLEIHRATLRDRSVTVSVERRVHADEGTHVKNVTALVAADRRHYHLRSVREGPVAPPDRLVWADGDALEYRLVVDGVVVERTVLGPEGAPGPVEPAALAEPPPSLVLELAADPAVEATDGGATLEADLRPDDRLTTGAVSDPVDPTLVASLGPDGFVEAYRVSFEATRHGEPVRVEYEVAFEDVGATEVPPVPANEDSTPTPTPTPAPGSDPAT